MNTLRPTVDPTHVHHTTDPVTDCTPVTQPATPEPTHVHHPTEPVTDCTPVARVARRSGRRRAARRSVAALGVFVFLLLVAAPTGATAPTRTGWWWVVNQGPVAAPPPPFVPDGGLYVAANPSGTEASAAVFVPVADDERPQTLTLSIASARGELVVGACPVVGQWEAAAGGAPADAPVHDCTRHSASGVVAADGSTISFDVSAFPRVDGLDVALLPGVADDGSPATFQLALERPGDATLSTSPTPTPSSPPPSTVSPAPSEPTAEPDRTSAATPSFTSPPTTISLARPPIQTLDPEFVPAPTAPPINRPSAVLPDPLAARTTSPAPDPAPTDEPADHRRALGLVGLVLVAAWWAIDSRRPRPEPKLLVELPEL